MVNSSIGAGTDAKEALEIAKAEIGLITGQRPVPTLAKKSIANFKLRKGQAIGAKVTLRGRMMYEFLERLIKMCPSRASATFAGFRRKLLTERATTHLESRTNPFFPRSSSTRSNEISVLT